MTASADVHNGGPGQSWIDPLLLIVRAAHRRFGSAEDVFRMVSRLAEETGELAQCVNHQERMGSKVAHYGEPRREDIAGEAHDVILAAISIADYYGVAEELLRKTAAMLDRYGLRE